MSNQLWIAFLLTTPVVGSPGLKSLQSCLVCYVYTMYQGLGLWGVDIAVGSVEGVGFSTSQTRGPQTCPNPTHAHKNRHSNVLLSRRSCNHLPMASAIVAADVVRLQAVSCYLLPSLPAAQAQQKPGRLFVPLH
jgi:hypothetical protein